MAIDYNRMRSTAIRLITENGRPVVVKNRVEANPDPVEGTIDITYDEVDADAVFIDITSQNKPEGEIQIGDKLCFVTEAVSMQDLILDFGDGESWQVITVDEKFPGPIKLVWRAVVRR